MEEESSLDFNFWASFADLMLALVLVLCMILFLVKAVIALGSVNLDTVKNNQQTMINSIAQKYNAVPILLGKDLYGISTNNTKLYDIEIQNDLNSQRITFSDKLLFRPDEIIVNPSGQIVLDTVGNILRTQLPVVKEIQIQGHADTQKSGKFANNTQLAAMRAIAVFEHLHNKVGIDPSENLMSATTFGEYKSVQRGSDNAEYKWENLVADNSTEELRSRNRRIEIVLLYRR